MVVVVHRIFSPAYKCDTAVGLLLCSVYEIKRNSRMSTGTVNYGNLLIDGRESVQTVPQLCCGTGLTRIPVTLTAGTVSDIYAAGNKSEICIHALVVSCRGILPRLP